MQREFIITRQGRDYVMYAGLLDAAHRDGLAAVRSTLVQAPSPANGFTAICHVEITTARGTFAALGDADPENAPRSMVNALVRLAETRAKTRALADATNIAMPVIEEQTDASAETTPIAAVPRSPANRPIPLPVANTSAADGPPPTTRFLDDGTATRDVVAVPRGDSGPTRTASQPPTPVRALTPDAQATGVGPRSPARTGRPRAAVVPDDPPSPRGATAAQLDAIGRLARSLGRTIPTEGLTRTAASELITQLSADRYPPTARRDPDPDPD
jgi:hypothetical protein